MPLSRGQAALLSLVLPGLSQVLLGRRLRGIIAFATTAGALLLGWSLLQDRLWFFQPTTPTGWTRTIPILVLPEFANLVPTLFLSLCREPDTADSLRHVLMPRDGEHLASMLTGFSGILSALWACDAWWLADGRRAGRCDPPIAAAVSWLLPGAGHVLAGQRSQGLLLGAAVLLMFAIGLAFGHGHSVDRAAGPLWWAAQAFCGIGVVFTSFVTAPWTMDSYPAQLELGRILCTVAGLMNLMVMTDAFGVAERDASLPAAVEPVPEAVA